MAGNMAYKIARVVTWTHNPEPRGAIHHYLKELDDKQLRILIDNFPGAAGTLGWLEWGRRKGCIPGIHLQLVEVNGKIEAKVQVPSPIVVENVTLDTDRGENR